MHSLSLELLMWVGAVLERAESFPRSFAGVIYGLPQSGGTLFSGKTSLA